MLSKSFASRSPLPLLLLLLVLPARAANVPAHLKQQQHPSTQHPSLHPQQQQQLLHQQQHQQQQQQAQYVHEKDALSEALKNDGVGADEDLSDPYQMLNELKHESRLPPTPPPPGFPGWPFSTHAHAAGPSAFDSLPPMVPTPKFLPFFGFPQPIFIPYPLYIAPEMFYPAAASFSGANNDVEESLSSMSSMAMSRAANSRRPSAPGQRNSPIYYVRLPPPTPYMFLPGLGYPSHAPAVGGGVGVGFSSIMPYSALPSIPAFSSVFNLPMNFLANGKPSSIYQIGGSPNDLGQSPAGIQFAGLGGFGARPAPPNPYKPAPPVASSSSANGFLSQSPYGPAPPPSSSSHQDSKMTALKRPFVFNGRPEEIYILPNNFNPLYQESGLAGYY